MVPGIREDVGRIRTAQGVVLSSAAKDVVPSVRSGREGLGSSTALVTVSSVASEAEASLRCGLRKWGMVKAQVVLAIVDAYFAVVIVRIRVRRYCVASYASGHRDPSGWARKDPC
jgi:hypothetical protein